MQECKAPGSRRSCFKPQLKTDRRSQHGTSRECPGRGRTICRKKRPFRPFPVSPFWHCARSVPSPAFRFAVSAVALFRESYVFRFEGHANLEGTKGVPRNAGRK